MWKTIMGVVLLLGFISGTSNAAPVTFSFDIEFTIFDLSGDSSTLTVTVDNGSSSTANQSYFNTDFLSASVSSGGLFTEGTTDLVQGSAVYITTDSFGIPTLDLSAALDTRVQFDPIGLSNFVIQLGTRDGSGPFQYLVNFPNPNFSGGRSDGFSVVGTPVSAVPGPAALPLLATALCAVGFLGWRRGCQKA